MAKQNLEAAAVLFLEDAVDQGIVFDVLKKCRAAAEENRKHALSTGENGTVFNVNGKPPASCEFENDNSI